MSHDLVSSTAEKLGNVEFSDDEFVMSLLNFITTENAVESFNILLPEANKSIYSTKHSISLLGTFDPSESQSQKPEKVKAPRQKRKVATQSEMKAPEKISVLKKSDKGAEKINTTLIQIENVIYFRFY